MAVLGPIIGGVASGALGAYGASEAAGKGAEASAEANALQIANQEKNLQRAIDLSQGQMENTQAAGNQALEELARGYAQQRAAIQQGGQANLDDIGRSSSEQLGFLGRGVQGAEQALSPALGLRDKVSGTSRLEQLLADPSAITQNPAFQFRQQQGEQALNRAAAARGGRLSGRTLKDLSEFNQGLASTELDAAARRAEMADAGNRQLAGIGFGAGDRLAGMLNQFGQQAGGVASQAGLQRRGVLGATTDALGQSFATQGGAVGNQVSANQAALNNLALQPFGITQAPGTGVNYQAAAQGAGTGSATLAGMLGDVGKTAIEAGFKTHKDRHGGGGGDE